jgi:sulfite reductase (NADPH) hemoprotein beta-component
LNYLEAVLRTYNQFGRRDNAYKARIKILVKAEGQAYIDAVEAEYHRILSAGGHHRLPAVEIERVSAHFRPSVPVFPLSDAIKTEASGELLSTSLAFSRWLVRNVWAHKSAAHRAVVLSLKRPGLAPGDITADQMDTAAKLADQFSQGELRVTHDLGQAVRTAGALRARKSARLCHPQHRPAHRHDRLPRR